MLIVLSYKDYQNFYNDEFKAKLDVIIKDTLNLFDEFQIKKCY